MRFIIGLLGAVFICIVLLDAFETILQPRRVTHRYRFARLFYRTTWRIWTSIALAIPNRKRREAWLAFFGPLSLLGLFTAWVIGFIFGFGFLHWSLHTSVHSDDYSTSLGEYLYMSGTTFFTLGYGDVVPTSSIGRVLAVAESGLGFAFLAVIISYLPLISQSFSKREVTISLLDARGSSPPSAAQVLVRLARAGAINELNAFLMEWEQWCAELLESHLSYPVLSFYRSQHDNQSWLAALTTMLDTCAIVMAELKDLNPYRAQLTFAMARHAAVDLTLILKVKPDFSETARLSPEKKLQLESMLRAAGLNLHDPETAAKKLTELRAMYEPFVLPMAKRFLLTLSPIVPDADPIDNWQRSAGMLPTSALGSLPTAPVQDEHF